ncbi:MAG TPA: hypothetical protein VID70_05350, partial [Solirubrobacteraceae bacterium]
MTAPHYPPDGTSPAWQISPAVPANDRAGELQLGQGQDRLFGIAAHGDELGQRVSPTAHLIKYLLQVMR